MNSPAYSDPPMMIKSKPERPVTMADVMMRLVQDLPIFVVLAIVGTLAIRGHADSRDFVITGLGGLLARSWPRAVQVAGNAGIAIIMAAGFAVGVYACDGPAKKPAEYGGELALCNQTAQTLQASIECENKVRAKYGRPPRPYPDGGTP